MEHAALSPQAGDSNNRDKDKAAHFKNPTTQRARRKCDKAKANGSGQGQTRQASSQSKGSPCQGGKKNPAPSFPVPAIAWAQS
mmetsp:Transcript_21061/g.29716  ORF Transcript_21061/g.29716 Transcript_21061/m.29716 type:complete len:83 (-) Transcript_21061:1823-2071(-)